jgi:ABC-2 type transport system permease protein
MNLQRSWAMTRKEFRHIGRDPRSLIMAVAIPMLMLVIFGYALTLDVDDVPMVVWDQSQTPQSRDLVSRFSGSRYFSVKGTVDRYAELERAIDERRALLGLVIPLDFARDVDAGRRAQVQIVVDGSDSNTATLAMGYADTTVRAYSDEVIARMVQRSGGSMEPVIDFRPRVWFNPELASRNFIVPGLIAVIMMVIAALLTSLTVAREWDQGTMEQLISTPVKGPELVIGKLVPYFLIGMFDVLIAVVMGQWLFDVPLRGSLLLLFVMASVFLVGALSLGMMVSIATRSQLVASQLAMVGTFLPSFLLSGFMFAITNMPRPIQLVTYVIPARYFIALLKGIYLKGVGLELLWLEALLLAVFGAAILTLAIRLFRKSLE